MKSLKSKLYLLLAVLILILSMLASCGGGQQPPEGGDDGEGDGGKDETPTNTADAPLDLESIDPVIIGANDTFIGDYILSANTSDNAYTAVENSTVSGEHILTLKKINMEANTPLTVDIRTPEFSGDWFVFSTDITIAEAVDTHTVLDISLGRMYNVRFVAYNGRILICDFNNSGFINLLDTAAELGDTFNLKVLFNNGEGVTRDENGVMIDNDMQAYVYINGNCIAKSTNYYSERHLKYEQFDTIHYSIPKDTEALIYVDNVVTGKKSAVDLPENPPLTVDIPDARSFWDDRERTYAEIIGPGGAKEIIAFSERMYNEDLYEWIATLYDPDTGAFYYSHSARDNFGFYPMAENVIPAMNIIVAMGITDNTNKVLAIEQMTKIASWAQLRHSNRDGYFYHPQWTTGVASSRRNNDIRNFEWIIDNYGFGEYFFSDAYFRNYGFGQRGKLYPMDYRLEESTATAVSRVVLASELTLAGMYDSADALRAELDKRWESYGGNSFSFASSLNSSSVLRRIRNSAELRDAFVGWLNDKQESTQKALVSDGRLLNGVWETDVDFEAAAALYHLSNIYNYLGAEMNYPKEIINTLINYMISKPDVEMAEKYGMSYAYAPLTAIDQVHANTEAHKPLIAKDIFDTTLTSRAKELILGAERQLSLFKKADGSYSGYPSSSNPSFTGIAAAVPGTDEGDIYASYDAFTVRTRLLAIFKLPDHPILSPYEEDVEFDMDGDGIYETEGHLERFQKLLWEIEKPIKNDVDYSDDFIYDFSSESDVPVNEYEGNTNLSIVDGALLFDETSSSDGAHLPFYAAKVDVAENVHTFSIKLKYPEEITYDLPHQMFLHNFVKIDIRYDKQTSRMYFNSRYFTSGDSTEKTEALVDKDGNVIYVDPYEWFEIELVSYPAGKVVDGKEFVTVATVKQGDKTYVSYLGNIRNPGHESESFDYVSFYSLIKNVGKVLIDDVKVTCGVSTVGDYNFDRKDETPVGASGGEMVLGRDNMYGFGKGTVSFDAVNAKGDYNFNEAEVSLQYPSAKIGDMTRITLKDSLGRVIVEVVIERNRDYITIKHAISGQTLIIVPADPNKDMTVRLEYHYDLDTPTLDVIVRYVDEPSEQSLVKPASLLNVPTCDPEADATDYAKLEVTSDSDSVLVDDVRARNSVKN